MMKNTDFEIKKTIVEKFDKSNLTFNNMNEGGEHLEGIEGVDEYIREFVSLLNCSTNFMTTYSCEGHKEGDSAYLFFSVNSDGWDIFWNKILPEICKELCFVLPEIPHALFQVDWSISVHDDGIRMGIQLIDFASNGKTYYTWQEKKEKFWYVVKNAFMKNLPETREQWKKEQKRT